MEMNSLEAIRKEMSAFEIKQAISDGINIFCRDVLLSHGLLDEDQYDSVLALDDMKYRIATRVALAWMREVPDMNWKEEAD